MSLPRSHRFPALLCAAAIAAGAVPFARVGQAAGPTDLDAFMREVVAKRDDNWKKLQQYILDERETTEVRTGAGSPLWGERREYAWYLRDGFFVRSPLKFNGATISEDERRKYEDEYLRRAQRRDQRAGGAAAAGAGNAGNAADPGNPGDSGVNVEAPTDVDSLIRQSRQPQFVSSAYFLRFKFDEGTYALVGKEKFDNRDVLKIEYYPTRLFAENQGRKASRRGSDEAVKNEMLRALNKAALVTLWIEPDAHQIVKYTLTDINLDFLPVAWLVRVDSIKAAMTMGQPFAGVWLPHDVEINASATLATGRFDFRRTIEYHDYRQADVKSKVTIPNPAGK